MQICVNGESRSIEAPVTVTALLAALGLGDQPVLVELDGRALHRKELATATVTEGSRLEVIRIVAGG